MRFVTVLPLCLFLIACASNRALAQSVPSPAAEHHAHLTSPQAAELISIPIAPEVSAPTELRPLLQNLGAAWNDAERTAPLFTEDATLILSVDAQWFRGRAPIADYLSSVFAGPYELRPFAHELRGDVGYLAAYIARGDRLVGQAILHVVREQDRQWRVAAASLTFPGPAPHGPITAEQLVAQLDEAGIRRAAVLSLAYLFAVGTAPADQAEYERVRAENDWTVAEAARFPTRLVAFCSVNPLRDFAIAEIRRCANELHAGGLKLHFGNSQVDIRTPEHAARLEEVFATANQLRLPIVVHLWTNPAYETEGAAYAEVFLNRLLPAAPDITVQIAHMAGGGRSTDVALAVFAQAIASGDPRTRNVYFDVATLTAGATPAGLEQVAQRMRQIGLDRILFGTDMSPPSPPARQSWAMLRANLRLSDAEFAQIAANVAPYLR